MTRHRKACCQIGITTWSGNSVEDEGLIISSASWSNGSEGRPTSTFCFSPLSDIYHAPSLNQARSSQYGGKFNDLAWTSFVSAACPSSILVAGGEDGLVSVYDSSYIVQGGECEMLAENRYHTGSVLSVNISKVDSRWLCSGDANGTVLLWDLTKPSYPMSLGRAYTASSLKQVAWNRCEMSVLASVLDNCVCVRDCRQPESTVLCLADQKHCVDSIWRCMSWHPHNSFSLCVASQNEDSTIQLWDMRFTSIPMFSYRPHSKGIYAIDWCPFDPAYLVSGGADSHILFHDPTNGRGVGICTAKGWVCQLMWCCRDPSLLAVSYYNEPVEVLSLLPLTSSMPSFADQWNDSEDFHLAVPASWMSTGSSGATFSFGKKLCCFAVSDEKNVSRSTVEIQKVDPDPFIHRAATSILYALEQNELLSFCDEQIRNCESCEFTLIWQYLRDAADSDTHRNRVTRIKKEISQRLDENVKKSVSQISGVEWNAVISNDFALVRNSLSSEAHNKTNCASVKSDVELRTLSKLLRFGYTIAF
ncbi:hypothetical protein AB6A40_010590 [Gnathostoma spinigerum]|uniref:Uncharacterized protein n=1 Tax=Gnathostoma spinigerum TaxID=75299 RepID=A0ABD6EX06_9BILA